MNGWDKFNEAVEKDNGVFVKIKDGEAIEGVFVGEPHVYYGKFKDQNEYSEWQQGLSFKFKMNFLSLENGSFTSKILQGSKTVGKRLKYLFENSGQDSVYRIAREGSGKDDTVYHIDFKSKLTEEQSKKIKTIELHSLKNNKESQGFEGLGAERPPIPTDIDYGNMGAPRGFEAEANDINFS